MRRLLVVLLAAGCAKPPPPQSHVDRPRFLELIATMKVQVEEDGPHGPLHRINAEAEREFWDLVSKLPVHDGGDELLLRALDEVYTRYEDNYWNGYLFHYPYLCSRKAVELADKLTREYPTSPRLERALWLKAFALRVMPPDPYERAEADFPFFAEQVRHRPDPDAARKVLEDLANRNGTYAARAKALLASDNLRLTLDVSAKGRDPRE